MNDCTVQIEGRTHYRSETIRFELLQRVAIAVAKSIIAAADRSNSVYHVCST